MPRTKSGAAPVAVRRISSTVALPRRAPPGGTTVRYRRVAHRPLSIALYSAFAGGVASFMLPATLAWANPQGQQVVRGSASFQANGNTLTVTNTPGAAINWQSFSIKANETTHFQQANSASSVLNRVVANNPSELLGNLTSNGKVVLINPFGITVGRGAAVDTAGFTASTLNITDADWANGKLRFKGNALSGDVKVDGVIRSPNGDVMLFAPNVSVGSEALIKADNGNVIIGAGQKVEVTGRGLEGIRFEIQSADNKAVNLGRIEGNAVGVFAGTLRHSGSIAAQTATMEGGRVVLRAIKDIEISGPGAVIKADGAAGKAGGQITITSATGDVLVGTGARITANGGAGAAGGSVSVAAEQGRLVVEQASVISADGSPGGSVRLFGGTQAQVAGVVTAASPVRTDSATQIEPVSLAQAVGGKVEVLGSEVKLQTGAQVDVSGDGGGGVILIGGDFQGANAAVPNAKSTEVAPGVVLTADGRAQGDGGRVIVWADNDLHFSGTLSARGGALGGNGGFAETSGKKNLYYRGRADLAAPRGRTGTLLLDPDEIIIAGGTQDGNDTGTLSTDLAGGTVFAGATPSPFTIYESEIEGTNANILLQANKKISVSGTFNVGGTGVLEMISGNSLTLEVTSASTVGNGIDLTSSAHGAGLLVKTTNANLDLITAGTNGDVKIGAVTIGGTSGMMSVSAAGSTVFVNGAISTNDRDVAFIANTTSLASAGSINTGSRHTNIAGERVFLAASSSVTGEQVAFNVNEVHINSAATVTGPGLVWFVPSSGATAITLGADDVPGVSMGLTSAELGRIFTPWLQISSASSNITVSTIVNRGGNSVQLSAGGTISQSAGGIITANELLVSGAAGVFLDLANTVNTFTGRSTGGSVTFRNTGSLTMSQLSNVSATSASGSVSVTVDAGNLTVNQQVTASAIELATGNGNVTLNSSASLLANTAAYVTATSGAISMANGSSITATGGTGIIGVTADNQVSLASLNAHQVGVSGKTIIGTAGYAGTHVTGSTAQLGYAVNRADVGTSLLPIKVQLSQNFGALRVEGDKNVWVESPGNLSLRGISVLAPTATSGTINIKSGGLLNVFTGIVGNTDSGNVGVYLEGTTGVTLPSSGGGIIATGTGNVDLVSGMSVDVQNAVTAGTGNITASTPSNAFVLGGTGSMSTGGRIFITADTFSLDGSVSNTYTGASPAVVVSTDNILSLGGTITADFGATVAFIPLTSGRDLDIVATQTFGAPFEITPAHISKITAGTLQLGNANMTGGTVTFKDDVTSLLRFAVYGSNVTQEAGDTLDVFGLMAKATGFVSLNEAGNVVHELAGSASTGFSFRNTGTLTVGSIAGVTGITTSASGGNIAVKTSSNLTVTGGINAGNGNDNTTLELDSGGLLTVTGVTVSAKNTSGISVGLVADDLDLNGLATLNMQGGALAINPFTNGRKLSLGSFSPPGLSIDATELLKIVNYDSLIAGEAGGGFAFGDIAIGGVLNLSAADLYLRGSGSLSQGSNVITAGNFYAEAGVIALNANNAVTLFAGKATVGDLSFKNANSFTAGQIGTATKTSAVGNLTLETTNGGQSLFLASDIETAGGDIYLTASNVVVNAATVNLRSNIDGTGNAGSVTLGAVSAVAPGKSLLINTTTSGTSENGGNVIFTGAGNAGGAYLKGLDVNAQSTGGGLNGTVHLSGDILLGANGTGALNEATLAIRNADVYVSVNSTIDTNTAGATLTSGGLLDLGAARVGGVGASYRSLTLKANGGADGNGGTIKIGEVAGVSGYLGGLTASALGNGAGATGYVELRGDITTSQSDTLGVSGNVMLDGKVVLYQNVNIFTSTDSTSSGAGSVLIGTLGGSVSAATKGRTLNINTSPANTTTATAAGNVRLPEFGNAGDNYVQGLLVTATTNSGSGEGIVKLNGDILLDRGTDPDTTQATLSINAGYLELYKASGTLTIDTLQHTVGSGGGVFLGVDNVNALTTGTTLRIDTSTPDNFATRYGGNIEIRGDIGSAGATSASAPASVYIKSTAAAPERNGEIRLRGDIRVGDNGTINLNGNVVIDGNSSTVFLASDSGYWQHQCDDCRHGGCRHDQRRRLCAQYPWRKHWHRRPVAGYGGGWQCTHLPQCQRECGHTRAGLHDGGRVRSGARHRDAVWRHPGA